MARLNDFEFKYKDFTVVMRYNPFNMVWVMDALPDKESGERISCRDVEGCTIGAAKENAKSVINKELRKMNGEEKECIRCGKEYPIHAFGRYKEGYCNKCWDYVQGLMGK